MLAWVHVRLCAAKWLAAEWNAELDHTDAADGIKGDAQVRTQVRRAQSGQQHGTEGQVREDGSSQDAFSPGVASHQDASAILIVAGADTLAECGGGGRRKVGGGGGGRDGEGRGGGGGGEKEK